MMVFPYFYNLFYWARIFNIYFANEDPANKQLFAINTVVNRLLISCLYRRNKNHLTLYIRSCTFS
jgi:hypothetical protein